MFRVQFLEKYFPEYVRRKKDIEFLELKQGNMTVVEYVAKFEELVIHVLITMVRLWRDLNALSLRMDYDLRLNRVLAT